jgi:hypothetical protein
MNVAAAIADAESLLRQTVPDLRDTPCYILTTDDAPRAFGQCDDDLRGSTSNLFDLAMEPLLTKLSRWCGRGFCCYLHLPGIESAEEFAATVLHENCHWLSSDVSPDGVSPAHAAFPWIMKAMTSAPDAADASLPRWHNHEVSFLRAACHVRYRAWLQGFPLDLADVGFGGSMYGCAPAAFYRAALHDEVRQRDTEPIRDILQTAPPTELATLWREDTGIAAVA